MNDRPQTAGFLFGATAALVVPAPKSFFIIEPPPLTTGIQWSGNLTQELLVKIVRQLDAQVVDEPRFAVVSQYWFDQLTREA